MRAMQMPRLGDPWRELELVDRSEPELMSGSVRIDVAAADLNFADILQCQGRYQVKLEPPFTPGMGAVGTVVAMADDVTELKVGDRIVGPSAAGYGAFADQALILAEQATVIPSSVDPHDAVAMHVTYGTSWFGLHHRGKLQAGETVLVLAAAGGVGSAAVELAKRHGCFVIAAAGGSKLEVCTQLGADVAIDYDQEDLYQRVMDITDNRGVDVVYDPVGGEYFDVARRVVAWEGRLLVIGFASGGIPSAPMNHALVKNYSIVGVHMGGYRQRDPEPFHDCYRRLYEMLEAGEIKPLIDRVVGFADLPDALTDLAERRSVGRIIFDPDE